MNICIAFTPRPANENPNILIKDNAKSTINYYEQIVVSFYTIRKHNSLANLIFVTTEKPPSKYFDKLFNLGVRIQITPFLHQPPDNYYKYFIGSFYLIDAILNQGEYDCLYLEPDIICIKPLNKIFENKSNIVAYNHRRGADEVINGLLVSESFNITQSYFTNSLEGIEYNTYGGGFHYIPNAIKSELSDKLINLYSFSISRFNQGQTYFTTEEHLLSAAYSQFDVIDANNFMKIAWTSLSYSTVDKTEHTFHLLHLPAEKEFGFKEAFRFIDHTTKVHKRLTSQQLNEYLFKKMNLNTLSVFQRIRRALIVLRKKI